VTVRAAKTGQGFAGVAAGASSTTGPLIPHRSLFSLHSACVGSVAVLLLDGAGGGDGL